MRFKRPTIRSIITLLLVLFEIVRTGGRVFAWDSLRAGMIDMRPLNRVMRLLTLLGLALVLGFLLSLLYSDVLRLSGDLELLPYGSNSVRVILTPRLAVPITFLAVVLGWSYLMTGAMHAHVLVRWGVLLLYFALGSAGMAKGWVSVLVSFDLLTIGVTSVGTGCLLLLMVVSVVILPLVRWPLAIEFAIFLVIHSLLMLPVLWQASNFSVRSVDTLATVGDLANDLVQASRALLIPMLFIAGVEMVNFGRDFSGWVTQAVKRHASGALISGLLLLLLAYRWYGFIRQGEWSGIGAWLGVSLLLLGLGVIAWGYRNHHLDEVVPMRLLALLIVANVAPQMLVLIGLSASLFVSMILTIASSGATQSVALANRISEGLVVLSNTLQQLTPLFMAALGVVIALIAMRRRRYAIAAFSLILAWNRLVYWLTDADGRLGAWSHTYADVDVVLLVVLTALTLFWLARGQLTQTRALQLLAVAMLAAVLNQTDFLDNPFSPFFGFAGIFFLAFGILWSVLTAGGRFLNEDSRAFPRASRVLMYLGYVLLSITIAHWYVVSHNVSEQVSQAGLTLAGFRNIGLALAYLVFVEGGRSLTGATAASPVEA